MSIVDPVFSTRTAEIEDAARVPEAVQVTVFVTAVPGVPSVFNG
jgi:hypothetical protein